MRVDRATVLLFDGRRYVGRASINFAQAAPMMVGDGITLYGKVERRRYLRPLLRLLIHNVHLTFHRTWTEGRP